MIAWLRNVLTTRSEGGVHKKVFKASVISYPGVYWIRADFAGVFDSKEAFFKAVKEFDEYAYVGECDTKDLYRISTHKGAIYVQLKEIEMNKYSYLH